MKVISQMISSIVYDPDTETLEVEFASNNSLYQYSKVPKYLYDSFMNDKSKGRFFLDKIKPFYEGTKLR